MSLRRVLLLPVVGLLLIAGPVVSSVADVAAVYDAILRGDYRTGGDELARLLDSGTPGEPVLRVQGWLNSFREVVADREDLRRETFEWNVKNAKAALEQNKTYLALSFTAQGQAYAADPEQYAAEPWIANLRTKALAAAGEFETEQHWIAAHSHYVLLLRIYPDDEEIEELRKQAMRHVRVELVYDDAEAVKRRIKDVTREHLRSALWRINEDYYDDKGPDFKLMAQGALQNLIALCQTTKLYDIKVFDGVANPVPRAYFLGKIEDERRELDEKARFGHRDLEALFNTLAIHNSKSISLPEQLLVIEFLDGALAELDAFTSMIWPADAQDFNKLMMGGFTGVGIQLSLDEYTGRLKVVTPLEDSPALEAGVQPDDLIVKVDGESTKGWTTDKAVREITGEAGTEVVLTMRRVGAGDVDFPLVRRRINLRTVQGVKRLPANGGAAGWDYLLDADQGVAYIKLTNFNPDSHHELDRALRAAEQQGMKALVLDLRFNPGGLLDVAVATVDAFLEKGKVVSTKGRNVAPERHRVSGKSRYPDLPLVVLVNDSSASASEILAGALRDHKRAMVLGDRTYGKGSVQRLFPLGPKARLKLTTAVYYLPSDRSPHKKPGATEWGVDPDWKLVLTPKEKSKILERERAAYIIRNGEEDQEPATVDEEARQRELDALKAEEEDADDRPDLLTDEDIKLLRDDPHAAPDADPQLETALLHLRVKLAGNLPWPRELAAKTVTVDTP